MNSLDKLKRMTMYLKTNPHVVLVEVVALDVAELDLNATIAPDSTTGRSAAPESDVCGIGPLDQAEAGRFAVAKPERLESPCHNRRSEAQ